MAKKQDTKQKIQENKIVPIYRNRFNNNIPKQNMFAEIKLGNITICTARNISNGFENKQIHAEHAVLIALLKMCGFKHFRDWSCFKLSSFKKQEEYT